MDQVSNGGDRQADADEGAARSIRPPSKMLTVLETMRIGFEVNALFLSAGLLATTPRGDGHVVLVLPGFATDDGATILLRTFLAWRGYDVRAWDLGYNLDHRTVGFGGERVIDLIRTLRAKSGRAISLVGWSLGGVIAREAARHLPDDVRQVVTLASPFTGDPTANAVRGLYERLSGNRADSPAARKRFAAGHAPLPMPSSAIFSKSDGIAAWQNCVGGTDAITENIQVHSSHFGMVANPTVFRIVADRLAQPEGGWMPYAAKGGGASI